MGHEALQWIIESWGIATTQEQVLASAQTSSARRKRDLILQSVARKPGRFDSWVFIPSEAAADHLAGDWRPQPELLRRGRAEGSAAETMIRLSGKEPGRDIAIEFVGPRPGEKLHEELWSETETVSPSSHQAIMLVTRPPIDPDWLEVELEELARLVEEGETLEAIGRLTALVGAPRRNGVLEDDAGAAEATPAQEPSSCPLRQVVVRVRHLERLVGEPAEEIAELVTEVRDDVVALRLDVRARAGLVRDRRA